MAKKAVRSASGCCLIKLVALPLALLNGLFTFLKQHSIPLGKGRRISCLGATGGAIAVLVIFSCGMATIDAALRSAGVLPTYTPTPTKAPTFTPTPRPTSTPTVATAEGNLWCPDCAAENIEINLWENGAANRGKIVGKAEHGDKVRILSQVYDSTENRRYYKVHVIETGAQGWVPETLIQIDAESIPPTMTPTPTAQETTAAQSTTKASSTDTPAEPAAANQGTATANVNLRAGPGTDYRILGGLKEGDTVEVIGCTTDHEWYHVSSPSGITAWVSARYVSVSPDYDIPVVPASQIPTAPPQPTDRPTSTPVQVPVVQPTNTPRPVCECGGDYYNCDNFSSKAAAQACFNYCMSIGRGDIHRLDRDKDGIVCE